MSDERREDSRDRPESRSRTRKQSKRVVREEEEESQKSSLDSSEDHDDDSADADQDGGGRAKRRRKYSQSGKASAASTSASGGAGGSGPGEAKAKEGDSPRGRPSRRPEDQAEVEGGAQGGPQRQSPRSPGKKLSPKKGKGRFQRFSREATPFAGEVEPVSDSGSSQERNPDATSESKEGSRERSGKSSSRSVTSASADSASDSSDKASPPSGKLSVPAATAGFQIEVKGTSSPVASTAASFGHPGHHGDESSSASSGHQSDSNDIPSSQMPRSSKGKKPMRKSSRLERKEGAGESEPSTSEGGEWRGPAGDGSGYSSAGGTSASSGAGTRQATPERPMPQVDATPATEADREQMLVQIEQRVAQRHSRGVGYIMDNFLKLDTNQLKQATVSDEVFEDLLNEIVLLMTPGKLK